MPLGLICVVVTEPSSPCDIPEENGRTVPCRDAGGDDGDEQFTPARAFPRFPPANEEAGEVREGCPPGLAGELNTVSLLG